MSEFIYNGSNESIIKAVKEANGKSERLASLLFDADVKKFECANIGSRELGFIVNTNRNETLEVKTYWYFKKKVLGKFVPSEPKTIWINSNGLAARQVSSLVSTFWHERIHFLDSISRATFGHDGNTYYKWKEQTAPYFVDALAEKIAQYNLKEDQMQRTDNANIIYYIPWYKRGIKWLIEKLR